MNKFFMRTYQSILKFGANFLNFREPKLISNEDSMLELVRIIKNSRLNNILVVTGPTISKLGLTEHLYECLKKEKISYFIYKDTVSNPTIESVEKGVEIYKNNNCEAIITFGGGSPMDTAKIIGARISNPKMSISDMKGTLKIKHSLPPFFAIPTTAGTGSEATVAAVITDEKTSHKYAISDPKLIPEYAVLDARLTVKLPKHITAATGMDALCHAIEAYIGRSNTKRTALSAEKAVKLIYENLFEAYNNGENLVARKNMLEASYLAGIAFTRAYVGNVHAMAHALGGKYHISHGLANAIIMPYVFKKYGKSAEKKFANLAEIINIDGKNNEEKANNLIKWIENMNNKMGIGTGFDVICDEDISQMAKFAFMEANPFYPVPKIFSQKDFELIYKELQK